MKMLLEKEDMYNYRFHNGLPILADTLTGKIVFEMGKPAEIEGALFRVDSIYHQTGISGTVIVEITPIGDF